MLSSAPIRAIQRNQRRGFIRDSHGAITLVDAPGLGSTQINSISSTGILMGFSHNGDGLPRNMKLFP